jgi:hypothetical protein
MAWRKKEEAKKNLGTGQAEGGKVEETKDYRAEI